MADDVKPDPAKEDWRPWARWVITLIVIVLTATLTGRQAVTIPSPPEVLPLAAQAK